MALLRATQAVFLLALAAWLAALVTGGLSAGIVFGNLPGIPLTLDRFAAWPAGEHGTLAAGLVMAKVFAAVDRIQLVAAPVAVAALAAQHLLLKVPFRRPAMVVRGLCVTSAAALFTAYALGIEPPMNGLLVDFWAAAEAGDHAQAEAARESFDRLHRAAATVLQVECVLVIVAVAASAIASPPRPEPA